MQKSCTFFDRRCNTYTTDAHHKAAFAHFEPKTFTYQQAHYQWGRNPTYDSIAEAWFEKRRALVGNSLL